MSSETPAGIVRTLFIRTIRSPLLIVGFDGDDGIVQLDVTIQSPDPGGEQGRVIEVPVVINVVGVIDVVDTTCSETNPEDIPVTVKVVGDTDVVVSTGSETKPEDVPRTVNVVG